MIELTNLTVFIILKARSISLLKSNKMKSTVAI